MAQAPHELSLQKKYLRPVWTFIWVNFSLSVKAVYQPIMEYFDFEGASSAHESNHQSDDVASVDLEFDEAEERAANFDSLCKDQPLDFLHDPGPGGG
ncbi:uncharacterized protein N7477_002281 [Penicillium maclennaniae]|uniref:uncharacterized protein n=1 Tax=Penicillium maclennaniae TaxID=1343394 RepID=UPI00253FFA0C|nr:uncharacterized protein N7477_002281 [Penicillium maclennaniae]KAJ5676648.1 hypothetical protein N7477_002281 [Penicillium maclennaniae]